MSDAYDLERFVTAQNLPGTRDNYPSAEKELLAGRKTSDWIWFVFPQFQGLGKGAADTKYSIKSREEAIAYLAHDVLGPRLRRCSQLVVKSGAARVNTLMSGETDGIKLRSSMTLFAEVADDNGDFVAVLTRYYDGRRDPKTLALLESASKATATSPPASSPPEPRRRRWWFRRGAS